MWLDVNGKRFQDGNTRTMIFDVAHLVHYISQFVTLNPGDLISTGTPPGVGLGQKPPFYLKAGDVMRLGIEGLGEQQQKVYAWDASLLDYAAIGRVWKSAAADIGHIGGHDGHGLYIEMGRAHV